MKNVKKYSKRVICGILAGTFAFAGIWGFHSISDVERKADAAVVDASITEELTSKRTKFTKQYLLSDGSFLANSFSMPVHYKKNGKWKEIDTTLVWTKSKKNYKTKSTSLGITVAQKANQKAEITWKRGSAKLSVALKGKKVKAKKAAVSNPEKKKITDIQNSNQVQYKKAYKNQTLTYEIYPEKIVEKISVKKKSAVKKITLKVNSGKLKVKVKNNRIYFKTKKGKTKYTRLKTILTDGKGVSTSKVKVTYNKKKKTVTLTPDKKWLNSSKRSYPMTVRTAYITDEHERDVRIGAAYAGAPKSNYTYDESLLVQANKCIAFTRMSTLAELNNPNVKVRDARLTVCNERTLKLGAGKTFDIGVHKVTTGWTGKKVTNNNRPSYDKTKAATMSLQKKGKYSCDVTELVKSWYQGVPNYGVALVAENTNGTHQARLQKNPTFSVHYEIVGFDGAVELKENQPITRTVLKAGQENYYYFDAKPGIAYDIYTDSSTDTQASMYDTGKERVGYDDNSGLNRNFLFTGTYNGRRYLKVSIKDKGTGNYTLHMKKRFAIPEPTGIRGQDKYTITWNAVEHAKEYVVSIYDGGKKVSEAVVTGTSYDYVYTNETAGKILGFTVTARESASLAGETSRMIYSTNSRSEWVYTAPMSESRKNASVASSDGKIYVLGGQTDTGAMAKLLSTVYVYNTETKQWKKRADMAQGRTNPATAGSKDSVYVFSKAGETDKADIYDIKADTWETTVLPDTSTIIDAAAVDNRVFVLQEKGEKMAWAEYLPEDNVFEAAGEACPFATADRYQATAVISGKIYLVKEADTKEVLVYDAYADEWSSLSAMNLTKKESALAASGNELYSIGGEMTGFGVLDVVEQYSVKVQTVRREMMVNKGEAYELQVAAGNMETGQTQTVTVSVDPEELEIQNASSFEEEDVLKEGAEGVTLLKYQPKKGVMVLQLTGSLERGKSYETYHSIPVEGKIDGKTAVEITLTKK